LDAHEQHQPQNPSSLRGWQCIRRNARTIASALSTRAKSTMQTKALFFDGFTVWDPRSVFALVEELFPGKGAAITATWRARQFEYNWLRIVSHNYADFWQCTEDALKYSAAEQKVDLTPEKHDRLMNAFLQLKAWPEVTPILKAFKQRGLELAFLSNLTPRMLEANVQSAGFQGLFDELLSTDALKTYKPDPRAYQMGMDAFKLRDKNEAVFVAFGGWDAAGAKTFGYPTFWNNRFNLPVEELGVRPDAIGSDFTALVKFLG
jgi:2-haloacid dehalogenase